MNDTPRNGTPLASHRTLALVGPAGAGKTTLLEQLQQHTGSPVTVSETDPLARELGHTLDVSLHTFTAQGVRFQILDTPGLPDLIGRTLSVLAAVDAVLLVLNAGTGVDYHSERLFRAARERGLDVFIVLNRIDQPSVDLGAVLAQVRERFGSECQPINLPAGRGARVADAFFAPVDGDSDLGRISAAHDALVDQIIELDEALMSRYLEQGEALTPEQLHDPFERALREGHVVPVLFAAARPRIGIAETLQVLMALAPHPGECNPPHFVKGEQPPYKPVPVTVDANAHALAHVFKLTLDPYVGRLAFLRIWQGSLRSGQNLFVGDARKPFRLAHLLNGSGKQAQEIASAGPGELVVISKIDELHYGAVVHDSHDEDHHHLAEPALPTPLHGIALHCTKPGDEARLGEALQKLALEDPSLRVEHRAQQNETVLWGLGDMHLRVAQARLGERANVALQITPPSVPYRETISLAADGFARHKKQTGGAGQFGEVALKIEPLARGEGFVFVDAVVGGAIPGVFMPAVEKGVREVLHSGAIAGFPLQDLRVTILDGKHHSVDSKEVAFVAAGRKAMLDAIDKAMAIILEPIAQLDIDAPAHNVGDITGELTGRRGLINGTDSGLNGRARIRAQLPIAELPAFQTRLRAQTGGEGFFVMELSHYEAVPPAVQKELAGKYKRHEEE